MKREVGTTDYILLCNKCEKNCKNDVKGTKKSSEI